MSFKDGAIVLVDAATGEPGERLNLGPALSSLSAGFGSVWVTKSDERTRNVLRINAKTRQRVREGSVEIARPGRNVAVATGAGAVWVAVRNLSDDDHSPESIVRIDPSTGTQQEIAIAAGVQDLAVGEGAVWVTNRFSATVTKIRVRDGKQARVPVGAGPKGIAVGEGAVWVAASLDDEITRINPQQPADAPHRHRGDPGAHHGRRRLGVGDGARRPGRLIRIDAEHAQGARAHRHRPAPVRAGHHARPRGLADAARQRRRAARAVLPLAAATRPRARYRSRRDTTPSCSARIARYERFWFCGRCWTPK